MQLTKEQIKGRILRKLIRWKKWGGAHTENIYQGLPDHIRGEKIVDEVMQELIQEQWLLRQIKTGEMHYSLNPRKVKEVMQFYEEYCQKNQETA